MKSTQQNNGIGFLGILTLVFITLKLAEIGTVATWGWFWVLSPTIIPLGLTVFIGLFLITLALIKIK